MPVSASCKVLASLCSLLFGVVLFLSYLAVPASALAQTELAGVYGRVTDQSGAVIVDVEVEIKNVETNQSVTVKTNGDGLYTIPSLHPGHYLLNVRKPGFKSVTVTELTLNVQDNVVRNFAMQVGSIAETVTVNADDVHINTTDAAVSTVIDRNFADNLPMNGRSFQTLINLTPGAVVAAVNGIDSGQFSVNGQRADSNYWMVDGVSANVGISALLGGNGAAGAVGTTSVLGGTNSLVSVDALQEFRIQTSTFAPEYGRTPGAQISIVTRSGTNQFHGSAFDYLRNDKFDANNWFNGVNILNATPLPKAEERQNDFGGTLAGPIRKDRTFFFFSYEGLRLRLPTTAETLVPDAAARQNALPALQPFLNAFPLDPVQPDLGNGIAQFNASYSIPATLDAYSVRIDHRLTDNINLFGRYSYSPSESQQRGLNGNTLNSVESSRIEALTATVGSTWTISGRAANELRFNYSRTKAESSSSLDSFGGATPLASLPIPSPYTAQNADFFFSISSLAGGALQDGLLNRNLQRQVNLVDNFSLQKGGHNLKFGVDYRRLTPESAPLLYGQSVFFRTVQSAEQGSLRLYFLRSFVPFTILYRNLGAFAQDSWRVFPRLTVTYGLRWDVDFSPSSLKGPAFPAAAGFDLSNFSNLRLAPAGTPAFKTKYGNVAPRVGLAYQISQHQDWGTVVRGGVGLFYDLATSQAANILLSGGYPFQALAFNFSGGTFPLAPAAAAPPPLVPASPANPQRFAAFDPNLKLPYALQWSVAIEQGLGPRQSLSASYIGSIGRRLIQTEAVNSVNSSITLGNLVANSATSDYNALQVQFQRRLLRGLQALTSYTWAHSIDTASAGSFANSGNNPGSTNRNENRASSDFDNRHALSAGLTYIIPVPSARGFVKVLAQGWSLEGIIQTHSASPVEIFDTNFGQFKNGFAGDIRPDVVPGIPFYLHGSQFPGGKALNSTPGAVPGGCSDGSASVGPFCPPPIDPNSGNPVRQGNLKRNALRGFGFTQFDLALHRDFPIHESLTLQFRVEAFNVLNHPNFAPPIGDVSDPRFGLSTQTLGQFLAGGGQGAGGFNSLYQIGGPRSMQFALKVTF